MLSSALSGASLFSIRSRPSTQPIERGGIPIEDVSFFMGTEKWRRRNSIHGHRDTFWPIHLIGAEHQPLAEPRSHQRLQVLVKLRPWQQPVERTQIRVDLRIMKQFRYRIVQ